MRAVRRDPFLLGLCAVLACAGDGAQSEPKEDQAMRIEDPHSYSRPWEIAVRHLELDLEVDFENRVLNGTAALHLDHRSTASQLVLDSQGLEIHSVRLDGGAETGFALGEERPFLGRPLTIEVRASTEVVEIRYSTGPEAGALQWLTPEQTSGSQPFLFTQSQAILARTWIPLQDTPSVRMTWNATVQAPPELLALMSAENPQGKTADGVYRFRMLQPVPSYLMALAVGDLEFRELGDRSGVYAEPAVIEAAAWELADTEAMIAAAEGLSGPYRWGRYDVLVLPPSFPFGGMENPRLTFATPTILAGDRSLVALVAHELAHSWSGNLVTNATWEDFWLNEGFTVYFEQRIMEEVFGRDYSEMLAQLSLYGLERELEELGAESADTHLHLDLSGRDPDEGMTAIAYDKGYFFLRMIEEAVGRSRWDGFLAAYFDEFAFQSVDGETFVAYLDRELLAQVPGVDLESLLVREWIEGPGLPANMPLVESQALAAVEQQVDRWVGGAAAADLDAGAWDTQRTLHFLHSLPDGLSPEQMSDLDAAFGFTGSGNSEILAAWLRLAVRFGYEPAFDSLADFLTRQGRRKFLEPLYKELVASEPGRRRAQAIYDRARGGYHPVATQTLDPIVSAESAP